RRALDARGRGADGRRADRLTAPVRALVLLLHRVVPAAGAGDAGSAARQRARVRRRLRPVQLRGGAFRARRGAGMTTAISTIFAGTFGAVFGSFFNVVAYRLPSGMSLSKPGSACPACKTPIKPYDNIPVLGWILLRGRCRACGEPISARYPIV